MTVKKNINTCDYFVCVHKCVLASFGHVAQMCMWAHIHMGVLTCICPKLASSLATLNF